MKILFVSDDFLPAITGVGIHAQQIAKELVRLGHEVVVLTSNGPKGSFLSRVEYWNNIKIFRTRTLVVASFPQALPFPFEISHFLKEEKIDLIHYHYLSYLSAVTNRASRKRKIPEIMTYHFSPDVLTEPWFMRPFRNLVRKLTINFSNKMKVIIVPSVGVKKNLSNEKIMSEIIHITNPVPFDFSKINIGSFKKQNEFTVLFVGRLAIEKNITYLLDAFKKFIDLSPSSILWIIGAGPMESELKERCKNLAIEKSVVFMGHKSHEELIEYYQKSHVFVLPSLNETLSLVAIEAMTFGNPIIVTNKIASANELVNQNINGFIVDADNNNELVNHLYELQTNKELFEKMQKAAFEHSKQFNLEVVMERILGIYKKILNSK
jgi:1,2-diacylglycerol 3-alpha-glucosyltransferase